MKLDNMKKTGYFILALVVLGAIIGFIQIFQISTQGGCSEINESYQEIKKIVYIESLESEKREKSEDVYDYYSLSSQYYDNSDYENTIYYCEKSREINSRYSQDLRKIKAEIGKTNSSILNKKKQMIETEVDYLFALYESCEYIESASRAYREGKYSNGNSNIEGQNEAITRHDNLVEKYYNLHAEYIILKKQRFF